MKCARCNHRYAANWNAKLSGGYKSPGVLLFASFLFALMVVFLFVYTDDLWKWVGVGATAICLYSFYESLILCKKQGANCPKCGNKNKIYPWSL